MHREGGWKDRKEEHASSSARRCPQHLCRCRCAGLCYRLSAENSDRRRHPPVCRLVPKVLRFLRVTREPAPEILPLQCFGCWRQSSNEEYCYWPSPVTSNTSVERSGFFSKVYRTRFGAPWLGNCRGGCSVRNAGWEELEKPNGTV